MHLDIGVKQPEVDALGVFNVTRKRETALFLHSFSCPTSKISYGMSRALNALP